MSSIFHMRGAGDAATHPGLPLESSREHGWRIAGLLPVPYLTYLYEALMVATKTGSEKETNSCRKARTGSYESGRRPCGAGMR